MFEQKAEGAISAAIGEGRIELQGAYAVASNVGLVVNAATLNPKDDEEGDGGKGGLLEIGLGYYRGLSKNVVFETYALVGGGDVENHFPSTLMNNPSTTGKIEAKIFRYGIQPVLGFKSEHIAAAVSTRITRLTYSDISGNLVFSGEDQVAYLQRENSHVLIEPAITLRGGSRSIKLQIQVGRSFNVTNSDFSQDDGHFTLGIGYYLDK